MMNIEPVSVNEFRLAGCFSGGSEAFRNLLLIIIGMKS